MNEIQLLHIIIISVAFTILFSILLYFGSRSLRNVVRLLKFELDPESDEGKKAMVKLEKMMRYGQYSEEEINFMRTRIHFYYSLKY